MARSIPSFPDPQNSSVPITDAYGYTAGIGLDLSNGTGSAMMNVHRTATSAENRDAPVSQLRIAFGEQLSPDVKAATVQEFLDYQANQELAEAFTRSPTVGNAWAVILSALDNEWAKHPALFDSTEV